MRNLFGILLALMYSTVVLANEAASDNVITSDSFAAGYVVNTDGNEAIYQLDLPESVYQTAIYHDLADMRIFNQQNIPVPYQIRHFKTTQKNTQRKTVPFYPLMGSLTSGSKRVKVITNAQGAIININEHDSTRRIKQAQSYLLDMSQFSHAPSMFYFDWDDGQSNNIRGNNIQNNTLHKITIETSNDLVSWKTLVNTATLVALKFAGQNLEQREVALPKRKAKYYRITWQDKSVSWQITKIEARFSSVSSDIKRSWKKITSTHVNEHRLYEFNTGGWWPLDRLKINMPEANTVAQIVLRSRRSSESPWQERYRGLVFDLTLNGQHIQSNQIELSVTTDPLWQIELTGDTRLANTLVPKVKFGWLPYQLVFVAQGEGPYTLAYGSAKVNHSGSNMQGLMQTLNGELQNIKPARLTNKLELGGKQKLGPPVKPFPWKTWLLWALMLGGVALLAVMAMHLYRQMNTQS